MKLFKLHILNCGIFTGNTIDFTDNNTPLDIICLSGVNGSGKTTIMELIAALSNFLNPEVSRRSFYFDRLKPNVLTRVEFVQLDLYYEGKILSIVFGEEKHIKKEKYYPQSFILIPEEIKKIIQDLEDRIIKAPDEEEAQFSKTIKTLFIRSKENLPRAIEKDISPFKNYLKEISNNHLQEVASDSINDLPRFFFFNAHDREIHDIRYNSIPKDNLKYSILNRYNPEQDDLKKLFLYYEYAYPDKFEELKDWINENVLEGKSIERINRPEFKVIIKTRNNQEHGLELLSSGEESLLIIISQLFLKASESTIFLIDEIGQSLHPEYQEKIMRLLKKMQEKKKFQVILSSHSKFIWNAVKEKDRIRLTDLVE